MNNAKDFEGIANRLSKALAYLGHDNASARVCIGDALALAGKHETEWRKTEILITSNGGRTFSKAEVTY